MEPGTDIKVNLFLIGSQKCGTTALFRLLAQHPQISVSSEKEPATFVDEKALSLAPASNVKKWWTLDAYHGLFTKDASAKYYAEGSTWYGMAPFFKDAAQRIHEYNPDARLIYVVREPVRRIISHYKMHYRLGAANEPIEKEVLLHPWYLDSCNYASVIDTYLSLFPRENLKVLIAERMQSNPVATMRDLEEWLGLAPFGDLNPGNDLDNNVTPHTVGRPRYFSAFTLRRLQETWLWRKSRPFLPSSIVGLVRKVIYRDAIEKNMIDEAALRQALAPTPETYAARLRDLLDDPIPEWGQGSKEDSA